MTTRGKMDTEPDIIDRPDEIVKIVDPRRETKKAYDQLMLSNPDFTFVDNKTFGGEKQTVWELLSDYV